MLQIENLEGDSKLYLSRSKDENFNNRVVYKSQNNYYMLGNSGAKILPEIFQNKMEGFIELNEKNLNEAKQFHSKIVFIVTGETYSIKDKIKSKGGVWNRSCRIWYFKNHVEGFDTKLMILQETDVRIG